MSHIGDFYYRLACAALYRWVKLNTKRKQTEVRSGDAVSLVTRFMIYSVILTS
jgi:hypothetical protein